MKKLMLLTGVLVVLLLACDIIPLGDDPIDEAGVAKKYFSAQNMENEKFYQLEAGMLAEGKNCTVWVERGAGITAAKAKEVADEYDTKIYNKMIQTFGFEDEDEYGKFNTMDYADSVLGDNDGKLTILLLDIKDGYNGTTNNAYTAGYFWAGNFYSKTDYSGSNECDMIFIDTYPGLEKDPKGTYATLAHEMQHLMNFATSYAYRLKGNTLDVMDTWVDEGLSSAAEWVYFSNHTSNGRVSSYKDNSSGLIHKGNNFFVWGNREDESQYAVLDDYATVYLFFQWLRLQNDNSIYYWIITAPDSDYRAVTGSLTEGYNKNYNWSVLLEAWLAANRINAQSGLYGYKGETTLKDIKAPYAPANTISLQLYPGEGVYSIANENPSVNSTNTIQYSYLTGNSVSSSFSAGDLLTFNKNTSIDGQAVSGTTTGVAANVQTAPEGRSVQASNEIIRLDARDMLIRNGNRRNVFDYSRSIGTNRLGRVR